ncbi:MAG: hypothetical protein ACI9VR_005411 [Cognaticolwellia sp.]|jgi:hypothetical protein
MFSILAVLGCAARQGEPEPMASSGQHVVAELPENALVPERERLLLVLDQANPAFQACYTQALARDPLAYGQVTLRVVLDATGQVQQGVALLSTLGDAQAEACIEQVAGALVFPAPSRPGLAMRYPLVFTSQLTPPEVTRALLLNNGLLTLEQEEAALQQAAQSGEPLEKSWVETW